MVWSVVDVEPLHTPDDEDDVTSRLSLDDWFFLSIILLLLLIFGINELVVWVERFIESIVLQKDWLFDDSPWFRRLLFVKSLN